MYIDKAKWVRAGNVCESPFIRGHFYKENVVSATLEICGLGFYEAYINGKKVSSDLFSPAWSDYEDRGVRKLSYDIFDKFSHRIYFNKYDVTALIQSGHNVIGVHLGNGWYNQYSRNVEGDLAYGLPKLRYALILKLSDGREEVILSDESLKWKKSHVLYNSIYFGEVQDLLQIPGGWNKVGIDESGWNSVDIVEDTGVPMMEQISPADRVIRTLSPKLISRRGRRAIYDIGQIASGYAVLKTSAMKLKRVIVRYADLLDKEGELDYASGGDWQVQEDKYILDGKPDTILKPIFTLHCGRFIEVDGEAEIIRFDVIHGDIDIISSFESSDDVLNWFYNAYVHTQLTNSHYGGVPSDCAHRERLGYTGDGQLAAGACMYTLDYEKSYEKWMGDIADCQGVTSGRIQHTAPFSGGGGGPGGWGCAIAHVPYTFWKHYGRDDIARLYYPKMLFWFNYLDTLCDDDLIVRNAKGGWCLGDWCTLEEVSIPEPFVNTYFYIRSLDEAIEISKYFGFGDEERLEKRKGELISALIKKYYDETTHSFADGIQGADAFAVDLGLGDEVTFTNLINKYEELGHFDTGIFGTDILCKALFKKGRGDLAVKLLSGRELGSYGYMRDSGATTLWEYWEAKESRCHPMFGAPAKYLLSEILGIKQEEGSLGFEKILISPNLDNSLTFAKGHTVTKAGKISVFWKKESGKVMFDIDMPKCGKLVCCGKEFELASGKNEIVI